MRPLMVASTLRPLSALTRNIALGSASSTIPSNSSLSPRGSLRSRRSLTPTSLYLAAPSFFFRFDIHPRRWGSLLRGLPLEAPENLPRDLARRERSVDPLEQPFCLVIRQKGCGHGFISIESFGD